MDYFSHFTQNLTALKSLGNYREFTTIERYAGRFPYARHSASGRDVVVWCNNDYLGMGQHPHVIQAMIDAAEAMGVGSGGTRNLAGTSTPLVALEQELAMLHEAEKALVMSSGYAANSTVISTLVAHLPNAIIYSDAKNHASMIEGVRFSGVQKKIFRHNDMVHLEELLQQSPAQCPKLIVFESVYSMDGDIGDIRAICNLAEKYDAMTYLDEVHAVGLYGKSGGGIAQLLGVADKITVLQGSLGKAFGVSGGYIVGKAEVIDYVRSFASGLIFTTAMSPVLAAGCRTSVALLRGAYGRRMREKLAKNVMQLRAMLSDAGIPVMASSETQILPIFVGDAVESRHIYETLLQRYGVYVQHVNYPTVPVGMERLRITPTILHTEAMMETLVLALKSIMVKEKKLSEVA